jgi:hypothetical protein
MSKSVSSHASKYSQKSNAPNYDEDLFGNKSRTSKNKND